MTSHKIKFAVKLAVVAAVITAVILISSDWIQIFTDSETASVYMLSEQYPLSIYVTDCGSGNCVLIHGESNILIDCGQEKADKNILNLMEKLSVKKLDLAILTHPDKDHIGNMRQVLEKIPADCFMTCENGDYETSEDFQSLLSFIEMQDIPVKYAKAGEVLSFGELQMKIISPTKIYDSENDNSVVVKLNYRNFSSLLTGDISKKAEKDILKSGENVSADFLLVPHHGSGTSSCEEFLTAVSPKYAVVSVSETDTLPNNGTMARLIKTGCEIYRTDESGDIAVVSDGNICKVLVLYNM